MGTCYRCGGYVYGERECMTHADREDCIQRLQEELRRAKELLAKLTQAPKVSSAP